MASVATTAEKLKRMYEECEKIVAEQRAKRNVCPYVCPSYPAKQTQKKVYKESGVDKHEPGPYVPGQIRPPKPRVYPADAPPLYLPQPTDTTNGDFLTMNPIDPWAAGHMDWSSHAGITGVRPVVDKYSITRYCLNDWRKHNEFVLKANTVEKGKILNEDCHRQIAKTYEDIDGKANHSNNMLKKRIDELKEWKKKVEISQKGIEDELEALEVDRMRLKGASRILMLPEAIAKECLELRTQRLEPDLVRDDAEQELIREVAIVGEIRKVFNDTLMKVEKQLLEDRAAKAAIDLDWSDKVTALKEDTKNASMDQNSSLILHHAGVSRWPENATSLAYWKHFCSENIKNTDEVRQRSEKLRSDLMTAIVKGGQDLKTQHDRTNMALGFTVKVTEDLCDKLEDTLKDCLQKIADVENLLDYLRDSLRDLAKRDKLAMSRLKSRNYMRPNVENCRDEAQYALMDEIKFIHESLDNLKDRMRQADMVRAELMKNRGDLEKEIACKRKSLNIDRDRMSMIRAHMPSPEEFASGGLD